MEIYIININDNYDSSNSLQRLLQILLTSNLSYEEMQKTLKDNYKIEIDDKIKKESKNMCNLGEGLWEKAEAKGKEEGKIEERESNINIFTNILISKGYSKEEAENIIAEGFSNTDNNGALAM